MVMYLPDLVVTGIPDAVRITLMGTNPLNVNTNLPSTLVMYLPVFVTTAKSG